MRSNSFAIRSSPHKGFSRAICRINLLNSSGMDGLPALDFQPKQPKALTMPANQSLWLDDHQRILPIEKFGEPNEREPGCRIKPAWSNAPFLIVSKLFAQEEILGGQSAP